MARDAGAKKVYLASAAPPVRYPNIYGIDMPTTTELIAHDRSIEEIREFIGADKLIYQDVAAMKRVVAALNPKLDGFEASCFDGVYIAGEASADEVAAMAAGRKGGGDEDDGVRRPRRADAAERGRARLMADRKIPRKALAAGPRPRHARRARGPAGERVGRELGSALSHQQLRPARRGDGGGALRQRGRSVHLFALHQPDGDDDGAPPRRARGHRGVHRDVERHERDPAARHGPAQGRRPRRLLAERVRLDGDAVRPRVRQVRRRDDLRLADRRRRVAPGDEEEHEAAVRRVADQPAHRGVRHPRPGRHRPRRGRRARRRQLLLHARAAAAGRATAPTTSSIPAPSTSTGRAASSPARCARARASSTTSSFRSCAAPAWRSRRSTPGSS